MKLYIDPAKLSQLAEISTLIATSTEDMPSPVKTSGVPNKQTLPKTLHWWKTDLN